MQDFYLELAIQQVRIKKRFFQILKKISQSAIVVFFVLSIFLSLPTGSGDTWHLSYVPILMIFPLLLFGLIIHLSNRVIRRMEATLGSISLN
ncbi:MAG: hypothetical protein V4735_08720 [Pseudomonadota bacterium]